MQCTHGLEGGGDFVSHGIDPSGKLGVEVSWVRRAEAEMKCGQRGSVAGRTCPWVAASSDLDERNEGFEFLKGTRVESILFVFDAC